MKRYYFVAYNHDNGYGRSLFETTKNYLSLARAERDIEKKEAINHVVIISFHRISKRQFKSI